MRRKGDDSKLRGQRGTKSLEMKTFKVFARNYRPQGADTVRSFAAGGEMQVMEALLVMLRRLGLSSEEALLKGTQQNCEIVDLPFR